MPTPLGANALGGENDLSERDLELRPPLVEFRLTSARTAMAMGTPAQFVVTNNGFGLELAGRVDRVLLTARTGPGRSVRD